MTKATDTGWEEMVEAGAEIIHEAMRFERADTTRKWVPGGNSHAQEAARDAARDVLQAAGVKELVEAAKGFIKARDRIEMAEIAHRQEPCHRYLVNFKKRSEEYNAAIEALRAALSDNGEG